jgi:hypothetical protein
MNITNLGNKTLQNPIQIIYETKQTVFYKANKLSGVNQESCSFANATLQLLVSPGPTMKVPLKCKLVVERDDRGVGMLLHLHQTVLNEVAYATQCLPMDLMDVVLHLQHMSMHRVKMG